MSLYKSIGSSLLATHESRHVGQSRLDHQVILFGCISQLYKGVFSVPGRPVLNSTEAATWIIRFPWEIQLDVIGVAAKTKTLWIMRPSGSMRRRMSWLLRKLNCKGRSWGFPKLDLGRQSIEIWFPCVCRVKQWGCCQGFIDILRWSGTEENSDSGCSFELC